jgi:hypothetical protein
MATVVNKLRIFGFPKREEIYRSAEQLSVSQEGLFHGVGLIAQFPWDRIV